MRMMLVTAILAFTASIALAAPEFRSPENYGDGDFLEYIDPKHFDVLGRSLANSSLRELQREVGETEVYVGGKGSRNVCYQNAEQQLSYGVTVVGYGYEVTAKDDALKCGTIGHEIINGMGVKLGLSRLDILAMLGSPSEVDGDIHSYIYYVQEKADPELASQFRTADPMIPMDEDIWLDVKSILRVYYEDGQVVRFRVQTSITHPRHY